MRQPKAITLSVYVSFLLGMTPENAFSQAIPPGDGTLHISNATRTDVRCNIYHGENDTGHRLIIKSGSFFEYPHFTSEAGFGLSCDGVSNGEIFDAFSPKGRYAILRLEGKQVLVEVEATYSRPRRKNEQ